jgi:hypothetical protein
VAGAALGETRAADGARDVSPVPGSAERRREAGAAVRPDVVSGTAGLAGDAARRVIDRVCPVV